MMIQMKFNEMDIHFFVRRGKAVPRIDVCDVCEHANEKIKIVRTMMAPTLNFEIPTHLRTPYNAPY